MTIDASNTSAVASSGSRRDDRNDPAQMARTPSPPHNGVTSTEVAPTGKPVGEPAGSGRAPSSDEGAEASGRRRLVDGVFVDSRERVIDPREGTLVLPFRRDVLFSLLPRGLAIAEVGVARGKFAKRIKRRARPSRLVLVDAWANQDENAYPDDTNNVDDPVQDARYKAVRRHFRWRHPLSRVEVVRAFADDAARRFAGATFDIAYIDANHEYAAVLEDLHAWDATLKPGGLLMGHDFAHHAGAKTGVVAAVRTFLAHRPDRHLFAITCEHFPSFVIGPRETAIPVLLEGVIRSEAAKIMVSVDDALAFRHNRLFRADGVGSALAAFGVAGVPCTDGSAP